MMVPVTPEGELKKIIEDKAKKANLKIKVVEKAGQKLSTYLGKFDKTKSAELCTEKDCLICTNSTKLTRKCRTPNIVYKISCQECAKNGIKSNYYGESNFNGYTRGLQHVEKYRSTNKNTQEKSALRRHAKEQPEEKKFHTTWKS